MDLLRPGPEHQVKILLLGYGLETYRGHWAATKTIACQLGPTECPHCKGPYPAKVYGFAHVMDLEVHREAVIMLTVDGCHNLLDAVQRQPKFRGSMFTMKRHMNKKTKPFVFLDGGFLDEDRIKIKAKSCENTIRRIWHFEGVVDPRASRG